MALQIASNLVPSSGGTFYLMEDVYLKGGLQVRPTIAARDLIAIANLKLGALVLTLEDKKIWMVSKLTAPSREDPDAIEAVEWEELEMGGGGGGSGGDPTTPVPAGEIRNNGRQTAIHVIDNLGVDAQVEFELKMGATAIVLKLETSRPIKVTAFGSPEKEELNPYEFISTDDHLADDGRQLLSDGSVLRTRNYSIFANFQNPVGDYIYFTVDNLGETVGPVTITVTFVTMQVAPKVTAPTSPTP